MSPTISLDAKRQSKIIRGKRLAYNAAIRDKYAKKLIALIVQMNSQCEREVLKLFKSSTGTEYFTAADDSISSQARILTNALIEKFNDLFAAKATGIAKSMVDQSAGASATALQLSLKEMSEHLTLNTRSTSGIVGEVLNASVSTNVGLIKSISQRYTMEMQGAVLRSVTTGNGLQDLTKWFSQYKGVTIRRARFIAKDQTKKVYSDINAARMKKMGSDEYEWLHSGGGQHPRDLHKELDGQICSLSKPPIIQYAKGNQPQIRGKPADLPNCGCQMRPIIRFD